MAQIIAWRQQCAFLSPRRTIFTRARELCLAFGFLVSPQLLFLFSYTHSNRSTFRARALCVCVCVYILLLLWLIVVCVLPRGTFAKCMSHRRIAAALPPPFTQALCGCVLDVYVCGWGEWLWRTVIWVRVDNICTHIQNTTHACVYVNNSRNQRVLLVVVLVILLYIYILQDRIIHTHTHTDNCSYKVIHNTYCYWDAYSKRWHLIIHLGKVYSKCIYAHRNNKRCFDYCFILHPNYRSRSIFNWNNCVVWLYMFIELCLAKSETSIAQARDVHRTQNAVTPKHQLPNMSHHHTSRT